MKNNFQKYLIGIVLVAGFWSCGGPENKNLIDDSSLDQDSLKVQTEKFQKFYQLPSPVELFMFMWEDGAPFYASHLNSIENASKYTDSKKKALNLGVYSADLAYCTIFDKNQETMKVFSATKKMAEDLGLTEGFDQSILDRIDRNIENSDSLYRITSDSYSKTVTFLQSQGQTAVLPYIIYGGWLESVFIATQTVKKYKPDSEIAIRINDQGLLVENLVEFFQDISVNDEYAKQVLVDLQGLESIFQKAARTEDGLMSKEVYLQLKERVKYLRDGVVK